MTVQDLIKDLQKYDSKTIVTSSGVAEGYEGHWFVDHDLVITEYSPIGDRDSEEEICISIGMEKPKFQI